MKLVLGVLFLPAMLFLPAGTLDWPEAWLYLVIQLSTVGAMAVWMWKNSPGLLAKRASFKMPVRGWDRAFIALCIVLILPMFVIPGLDAVRYRWSQTPFALKLVGFIGVVASMIPVFLSMKVNPHASKIVEIEKDSKQKVITTGPYSFVRHPMYLGFIVLFVSVPLALGSLYALIPGLGYVILIVWRTYLEDKTLLQELPRYEEYARKVRFRLLPGVW